jgi:hypothetical protein
VAEVQNLKSQMVKNLAVNIDKTVGVAKRAAKRAAPQAVRIPANSQNERQQTSIGG